ncbi:hypothetical protein D3C71_1508510 [compost metagenome]
MPRNTSLNCTMPELVNISVGSLPGTSGLDATTVWPLETKKSRNDLRMSATENVGVLMVCRSGCAERANCRKNACALPIGTNLSL